MIIWSGLTAGLLRFNLTLSAEKERENQTHFCPLQTEAGIGTIACRASQFDLLMSISVERIFTKSNLHKVSRISVKMSASNQAKGPVSATGSSAQPPSKPSEDDEEHDFGEWPEITLSESDEDAPDHRPLQYKLNLAQAFHHREWTEFAALGNHPPFSPAVPTDREVSGLVHVPYWTDETWTPGIEVSADGRTQKPFMGEPKNFMRPAILPRDEARFPTSYARRVRGFQEKRMHMLTW